MRVLTEFYKRKGSVDGTSNTCKPCIGKKRYIKNRNKRLERAKNRSMGYDKNLPKRRNLKKVYVKKWKQPKCNGSRLDDYVDNIILRFFELTNNQVKQTSLKQMSRDLDIEVWFITKMVNEANRELYELILSNNIIHILETIIKEENEKEVKDTQKPILEE